MIAYSLFFSSFFFLFRSYLACSTICIPSQILSCIFRMLCYISIHIHIQLQLYILMAISPRRDLTLAYRLTVPRFRHRSWRRRPCFLHSVLWFLFPPFSLSLDDDDDSFTDCIYKTVCSIYPYK
ncbi:hypothetical protein GYMLUDRAFT_689776 [Collybiopsis luxurians FD-317 M1]|uniref:Uncharacterized protein n=1 Tax=Collybiopsis luxurians FD-317 M1 TaxID=944289 RepID=A0A0D0C8C4_9AGAR|nr:hypothetical protein GYMLUDRAFT_689776 [Collybiopsis luxurians FD-317 M1]